MSIFDTFANSSLAPWLTGYLGRAASYLPKGGATKAIKAVLFQPPPEPGQETPRTRSWIIHALVSRADVTEVNRGGDRIQVGTDTFVVEQILDSQSPGMWAVSAVKETGRG